MAAKTRTVTLSDSGAGPYGLTAVARRHSWAVDEPAENGGSDSGPEPFELLCAALGGCTAITVRMYAARKQWALERITVTVTYEKPGETARFTRRIALEGALDAEQRTRLMAIADRCPVHLTLSKASEIVTTLAG